jgi:alpha-glucosidase (family GH31 glycosyl hydrolase)
MAAFMPALNSFHGTELNDRTPQSLPGSYRSWIAMGLGNRMRLMPYFRTLMHEAIANGVPAIRPLFMEFSKNDPNVYGIHDQFLVGDSILISPILDDATQQLNAYFPYSTWYGLWTGDTLQGTGDWKTLEDIKYQVAAHLRGGTIIPMMASERICIFKATVF